MRALLLVILMLNSLYAHKLYILGNDDGKTLHIRSYFTKNSFCQNCQVEILDIDKKILFKGKTDKKGEISFPFVAKNVYIDVVASMGHKNRVFYESENEMISEDKNESYLKIIFALGIIALIFFVLRFIKK
jgi:nickel transport protein